MKNENQKVEAMMKAVKFTAMLAALATLSVQVSRAAERVDNISCHESFQMSNCYTGEGKGVDHGPCVDAFSRTLARNEDGTYSYKDLRSTQYQGQRPKDELDYQFKKLHCVFGASDPQLFYCVTRENAADLRDTIYIASSKSLPIVQMPVPEEKKPLLNADGTPALAQSGKDGQPVLVEDGGRVSAPLSIEVFKMHNGKTEVLSTGGGGTECEVVLSSSNR